MPLPVNHTFEETLTDSNRRAIRGDPTLIDRISTASPNSIRRGLFHFGLGIVGSIISSLLLEIISLNRQERLLVERGQDRVEADVLRQKIERLQNLVENQQRQIQLLISRQAADAAER